MQSSHHDQMLESIGARIAHDVGDGATREKLWQFRNSIRDLATQDKVSKAPVSRWLWAPIATAFIVAIGFFLTTRWARTAASDFPFWVGIDPHQGKVGAMVSALDDGLTAVGFPGNSEIVLRYGAQAKVLHSTDKEVRVRLESGEISANIHGNGKRRWSIEAGAFRVEVVGTRFAVSWDPSTELLDVAVVKGEVRVEGTGFSDSGIRVKTGKHLFVDRRRDVIALNDFHDEKHGSAETALFRPAYRTSGAPMDGADSPPIDIATAMPNGQDSRDQASTEGRMEIEGDSDSRGRHEKRIARRTMKYRTKTASQGRRVIDERKNDVESDAPTIFNGPENSQPESAKDLERLLQKADDTAIADLISTTSLNRLWRLMRTARRIGMDNTAIDILSACRNRFPLTQKAGMSAFLLGKIYEEKQGDRLEAIRWFQAYLDENPMGALAEESEGRMMVLFSQLGNSGRARKAATRYLRKYPKGAFNKAARSISGR